MRKLIEFTLVSIDGVVDSPERWAKFDDEASELSLHEIDNYDAFVMGRSTTNIAAGDLARVEMSAALIFGARVRYLSHPTSGRSRSRGGRTGGSSSRCTRSSGTSTGRCSPMAEFITWMSWGRGASPGWTSRNRLSHRRSVNYQPDIGKQTSDWRKPCARSSTPPSSRSTA